MLLREAGSAVVVGESAECFSAAEDDMPSIDILTSPLPSMSPQQPFTLPSLFPRSTLWFGKETSNSSLDSKPTDPGGDELFSLSMALRISTSWWRRDGAFFAVKEGEGYVGLMGNLGNVFAGVVLSFELREAFACVDRTYCRARFNVCCSAIRLAIATSRSSIFASRPVSTACRSVWWPSFCLCC